MTAGPSRRAWALGTGLPAQNFAQGQIKYVDLDLTRMEGRFAPILRSRERHFRDIGCSPPDRFLPPPSPGATSARSVDKNPDDLRRGAGNIRFKFYLYSYINHWQDGMLFAIIVGWE